MTDLRINTAALDAGLARARKAIATFKWNAAPTAAQLVAPHRNQLLSKHAFHREAPPAKPGTKRHRRRLKRGIA